MGPPREDITGPSRAPGVPSGADGRFSRQTILPGVGAGGQDKWAQASILLAGGGTALLSAAEALVLTGVERLVVLSQDPADRELLDARFPANAFQWLDPSSTDLQKINLAVVVTDDPVLRMSLSRRFRVQGQPALFGWCAGEGYALFLSRHSSGSCPCLECFEVLNPKSFGRPFPGALRLLGAAAAAETVQWVLSDRSPLENKVWITSLASGVSFFHEVAPSLKCPARLKGEGAPITP